MSSCWRCPPGPVQPRPLLASLALLLASLLLSSPGPCWRPRRCCWRCPLFLSCDPSPALLLALSAVPLAAAPGGPSAAVALAAAPAPSRISYRFTIHNRR